ncbi:MAG: NAD(P)/FAD-dependent oxidoreductase [Cellulosilyticaceae bacterium]
MIRVQDIKLTLQEDEQALLGKIAKKLRIKPSDIDSYTIFKQAVDARKKDNIVLVYTLDVVTSKEQELLKKNPAMASPSMDYVYPVPGTECLEHRPVVVGTGPCGLFAALILAQQGYEPIVLERGKSVEARVEDVERFWNEGKFDPKSNVQFGEGGAGTFSDGKLTTQIKNKRCHKVLQELVAAGAPEPILYKNKPHVGTDILRDVVKNMRVEIERLGGEIRFESQLTDLRITEGQVSAVQINHSEWLESQVCVLAIGHSARDTFEMLHERGIPMEQKPFSMGMRVEHLQEWIDKSQYGVSAGNPKLGAAEYKLVHHAENGRAVYSFCMCPGGYVIASASEEGMIVTNGMSEHGRDGANANSAVLVNIGPQDFGSEHPLAGMMLQREFEKLAFNLGGGTYKAPVQTVGDFLEGKTTTALGCVKPTYTPGVVFANLREALPTFMGDAVAEAMVAFGRKIKAFDHKEALFTGFETRSSSPVRTPRDGGYESTIRGLYPAGEGAGYAGGITSAAVDGIEVAEAIITRYGLPERF